MKKNFKIELSYIFHIKLNNSENYSVLKLGLVVSI